MKFCFLLLLTMMVALGCEKEVDTNQKRIKEKTFQEQIVGNFSVSCLTHTRHGTVDSYGNSNFQHYDTILNDYVWEIIDRGGDSLVELNGVLYSNGGISNYFLTLDYMQHTGLPEPLTLILTDSVSIVTYQTLWASMDTTTRTECHGVRID